MSSEAHQVARSPAPLARGLLAEQLRGLGLCTGEVLLVHSSLSEEVGAGFERSCHVARGEVGLAECRLMRQRELVDFAVSWFERNRGVD